MILKEIDLFKGIDYAIMEQIADICVEEIFKKDDRIFEKGEVADCLYILVEGGLKLVVENGASLNFSLTEPGTIFGWSSMAESGKYTSSGVCATDLKTVKIDRNKLDTIFKHHPEAGFQVLRRLMDVFSDRLLNAYRAHLDLLVSKGSQTKPSYG
ncbi:Crp/Fnr family transcriptional regulator [Desulfobacula phenolica]|uniref:Cyclic nucleotide-binding domain-containing protein n=1 Tax=Desulfobacula phenolica TaxID=90732 RepID=A0A1H2GI16_9BACT|nr:Crp/Fnr family transcriptional regulator [Desulfobacula phenolica]SDU19220.1 Cyclic nucleotide-binding domain-containing protein [Desulfobacula phenolica]